MTEPEQWAVDLAKALGGPFGIRNHAPLTIQRAFEERERELREAGQALRWALKQIATVARSPVTMQQIARQALATRQDAPVTENSHD